MIGMAACAALWQIFAPQRSNGSTVPVETGRELYVAQEKGEYAYERSVPEASPDDEPMPILWVRLTGMQGGVITLQGTRDASGLVLMYRDGCQFINVLDYWDGKLVSQGTIRVSNDPELSHIIKDALAGRLSVSPTLWPLPAVPAREIKCDTR